MMLAIKSAHQSQGWTKEIGFVAKVQPRYARKYQMLCEQNSLDSAVVAQLLTALFFDASGFNCTEITEALFWEVLPAAFENLAVSVDLLKEQTQTPKGRSIFVSDVLFKKLESI